MSFTWKNGRQLASLQNGNSVVNYTYNADGVRIGKSGSKNITYEVSGTQIISEKNGTNTTYYLYDESGSPIGLTYKGTTYYYRKNLQGDVISILNSSGTKVVTYTYNAWGKVISITGNMELGVNNPFRYRGYYYDTESGLYYLNSRYYDPLTGRFINADSLLGTNGFASFYNLFAYCGNNCVSYSDCDGNFSKTVYILNEYDISYLGNYLCTVSSSNKSNDPLNKASSLLDRLSLINIFGKFLPNGLSIAIAFFQSINQNIPKYYKELDDMTVNISNIALKYRNGNYKFKITLLFGSHNNQLQIQVYKVCLKRVKNSKGKYTSQRKNKTIETFNYELLFNDSTIEIQKYFQQIGIRGQTYSVNWGYNLF